MSKQAEMVKTIQGMRPEQVQTLFNDVTFELCYRKLHTFAKHAWHILEHKPFHDGWHIGCICEHLEAVSSGQLNRLLINIPPRHMKSLTTAVLWEAWHWLRAPWYQWLLTSYHEKLSTRDNVKCRRLVEDRWYKELQERTSLQYHPEVFDQGIIQFVGDQNTKIRYENQYLGYRLATSLHGSNTGEGGDGIIIDDPNNVREAESDVMREETILVFDEVLQTRLNDPDGPIVVMQQRTHENDLTGHIVEKYGDKYTYLILPARYEKKTFVTFVNEFGEEEQKEAWPPPYEKDPRTEEGEPLWKSHYPEERLADLENSLGEYAAAGQLQQRPHPRQGGIYKPDMIPIIDAIPAIRRIVRYWDKAGTDKNVNPDAARSAGVKLAELKDPNLDYQYVIMDVRADQWSIAVRNKIIKNTAEEDGVACMVFVEQEPGSGGKESAEITIKQLAGFKVEADRVTGSKVDRAGPAAAQVNIGNIAMLRADWNAAFKAELRSFPTGKMKDMADAFAGAFNKLVLSKVRRAGTW